MLDVIVLLLIVDFVNFYFYCKFQVIVVFNFLIRILMLIMCNVEFEYLEEYFFSKWMKLLLFIILLNLSNYRENSV